MPKQTDQHNIIARAYMADYTHLATLGGVTYRYDSPVWAPIDLDKSVIEWLESRARGQRRPIRFTLATIRSVSGLVQAMSRVPQFEPVGGVPFKNGVFLPPEIADRWRAVAHGSARWRTEKWDESVPNLVPHAPEHHTLDYIDLDYTPGLPPPERWLDALRLVWKDTPDLEARVQALREFVGLSLMGLGTRFQKCLVMPGEGDNGKSTIMRVIEGLFPARWKSNVSPRLWSQPAYLAHLEGRRVNVTPELPTGVLAEEAIFKAVVSGDPVAARRLYKDAFEFRPVAGHIFATNELPSTKDQSHGYWRRFVVLTFPHKLKELLGPSGYKTADQVHGELMAEKASIVQWALEGARMALDAGALTLPDSHVAAASEWRQDADAALGFVAACCVVDEGARAPLGDLYRAFLIWARMTGRLPMAMNTFGKRLNEWKIKTNGCMRYKLAIRPGAEWDPKVVGAMDTSIP